MTREERKQYNYNLKHKSINGIVYKQCSQCKEWKPMTEEYYYKWNQGSDGFHSDCCECRKEKQKEYLYAHLEEHDIARTQWYWDNRDEMLQKFKNWRKNNKEWKQEYQRIYFEQHPEQLAIYAQNKRLHETHRITKNEWNACLKYFNHRCAYCGLPIEEHYNIYKGELRWENLNKEHAIHKGGNRLDNCIPSCKSCNDSKWEYNFDEWYTEKNPNFTQEQYNRIVKWLMEDCFKYVEAEKPKQKYVRKAV